MRVVYLGTSAFAAAVLRSLNASESHEPVLVLSRPDSPQGRGRRLQAPPAVMAARDLGIDVYQPGSVNADEALARIGAARPDVLCVCAFGALIREPLLSDHLILNVHPSLLPRWRGAAPVERAILAGDDRTGVSIMRLEAGLDSGPVCLQQSLAISPVDDYGTLAARLEALGGELLVRALDLQAAGALGDRFQEQPESGVTYAEKLTAADRPLDPARPAVELERQVRALAPHIGAQVELADGARLGVWRASAASDASGAHGLDLSGELPRLVTGAGALVLDVVQPPGRKRMSGADYLRGLTR